MAKAPTRAQQAVALARAPCSMIPQTMSDARVHAYAGLSTHIGAIPGCALAAFTIAPFAGPDGKTATTITVRGRGPTLHASIMEWKVRAVLDAGSPQDVERSLIATFRPRIERQRTRADDAIAILGQPLPGNLFETNTACLHLAIDRMSIWAQTRIGRVNPRQTQAERDTLLDPHQLRLALGMCAARAAKNALSQCTDTGMASVGEGDFSMVREIRTDTGLVRQVALKDDIAGFIIGGSSIVIPRISMPETIRLAGRTKRLSDIIDFNMIPGPGFAAIVADRTIIRIDQCGDGIIIDLVPDLVVIDDVATMDHQSITGLTKLI